MMKQLLSLLAVFGTFAAGADELTFRLAGELLNEGGHELSAVEFRRFAMETETPAEQAAAYLYASYAYLQAGDAASAGEMADRAEEADLDGHYLDERTLFSAESARLAHDTASALYFYDALAGTENETYQSFARRRAAAVLLSQGSINDARRELQQSPAAETAALEALETYADGKDKSPKIGGLLGLFPGAGYWYSGETANGLRSLILNSLFMYGMYQTASDDQWGAFGVLTFFELTWYSGSIYGGIDAAQRRNHERLHTAVDAVGGRMSYRPEPEIVVPVFKLNILF